ncbi:YegJ family protein [Flavobacterium olei]|uniref:YegJ family protein n=1 Tax=Flavobacterium olei TaxID=1886782 RepID=UPI00321ADF79
MRTKLIVFLSVLFLISCKESNKIERENEPVIYGVKSEDKEMNDAIAKANQTLSDFNKGLENPNADSQALKVKFANSKGVEHMWVGAIQFKEGKYVGILNNTPEYVTEYKAGDSINVDPSKISDWMYLENGKLFGGYTIRVLRNNMSEEERKQFDSESGMQID